MAIELPSDVALEGADDLALGAALRGAPGDVGMGARVEDHAHHDDAPERVVRAASPPRLSRLRMVSPEEASIGATPQ